MNETFWARIGIEMAVRRKEGGSLRARNQKVFELTFSSSFPPNGQHLFQTLDTCEDLVKTLLYPFVSFAPYLCIHRLSFLVLSRLPFEITSLLLSSSFLLPSSMSSPADFAKLLGISTNPDGYRNYAFSPLEYRQIIASYTDIFNRGADEFRAFWVEFSAMFLPQLVQSYMIRPFDEDHSLNSLTDLLNYTCWIRYALDSNLVGHFVRTRPADALELWAKTSERLSRLSKEDLSFDATVERTRTDDVPVPLALFDRLLALWGHIRTSIINFIPVDHPKPSPESATGAHIRSLLPAVRRQKDRWDAPSKKYGLHDDLFYFINFFESGGDGTVQLGRMIDRRECLFESMGKMGYPPPIWWNCEAEVLKLVEGKECVGEKSQMLMCSRCHCVRYCSPEHQKLDWKAHKRVCFKLQW
ncbi:hypothetical protein BDY24DRAFT_388801 [Mrakia frigida]|uniref:zinc finger MYND domain-containing protein n=1 Tax=Mrakia frigida TaxID=29902 RepID=UPI003FCBF324